MRLTEVGKDMNALLDMSFLIDLTPLPCSSLTFTASGMDKNQLTLFSSSSLLSKRKNQEKNGKRMCVYKNEKKKTVYKKKERRWEDKKVANTFYAF